MKVGDFETAFSSLGIFRRKRHQLKLYLKRITDFGELLLTFMKMKYEDFEYILRRRIGTFDPYF